MATTKPPRLTAAQKQTLLSEGPISWRNWRAYEIGTHKGRHAYEVLLYSDSRFVGELAEVGPYAVLNTVAGMERPRAGNAQPALVLRIEPYGERYLHAFPREPKPTSGSHHGGSLADEVAALLSLALDIRCRANGVVRWFGLDKDPRGRPRYHGPEAPVLIPPRWPERPQLPRIAGERKLDDAVSLLELYPRLDVDQARALVRAARLYEQALWTADADPASTWLQLVNAVEVAAVQHVQQDATPWRVLTEQWKDIADLLRDLPRHQRDPIAELLAPLVRAARRYRRFLRDFKAAPPRHRPRYDRVNWRKLGHCQDLIYGYRSQAVHQGIPMPAPMCIPPGVDEDGCPLERDFGLGVGSGDSYWDESRLPMLLHVYAYIVGGSLRAWWRSMVEIAVAQAPGQ